ncbi:MAG: hypothetical protein ABJC33_01100 [Betaproteobacteria bacterium]
MKSHPAAPATEIDNASVAPARTNRRQWRTRRQCADWDRDGGLPLTQQPLPALADRTGASAGVSPAKVAAAVEALEAGRLRVSAEALADAMLSGALAGLRKYS